MNLMVKSKFNPKNVNFNKKPEHKKKGNFKDKMKMKTKGKKCFYCLGDGHFIKDCPKRIYALKNKSKDNCGATLAYNDEANIDEVYVAVNCLPCQE